MIKNVIKKIKEGDRERIKYIYPIESEEVIARYISAFSNTEGGDIVFGVMDNGKDIFIKSFPYNIKQLEIEKLLNNMQVKVEMFEYEEIPLQYIHVDKSETMVTVKNVPYTFDEKMQIIELKTKKIFLSYCHKDKDLADIIENKISEVAKEKIKITRDITALKYKDSLDEFMQTIKQHDYVISVVSNNYLKSIPCMYEIAELMKDTEYYRRLLFVVIGKKDIIHYKDDDLKVEDIEADIYSFNRFDYIKFWSDTKKKLDDKIKTIENTAFVEGMTKEVKKIEKITLNIDDFIAKLSDGLGISFEEMLESDFRDFIDIILDINLNMKV